MGAIGIFCHWHTGSSITAKALQASGLVMGDEKTRWTEECYAQCEHGRMNAIGDNIWRGNVTNELLQEAAGILESYNRQARIEGWENYGFKFTHILQKPCFDALFPIFQKYWPDAKYVVIIRHPLEIIESTKENKDWTEQMVIDSFMSTIEPSILLLTKYKAKGILFPDDFITTAQRKRKIKSIVDSLGLDWWDSKAGVLFKRDKIRYIAMRKEKVDFAKNYPDVAMEYARLITLF